jgi:hypothetical protein
MIVQTNAIQMVKINPEGIKKKYGNFHNHGFRVIVPLSKQIKLTLFNLCKNIDKAGRNLEDQYFSVSPILARGTEKY